jgi:hypothetical protein
MENREKEVGCCWDERGHIIIIIIHRVSFNDIKTALFWSKVRAVDWEQSENCIIQRKIFLLHHL